MHADRKCDRVAARDCNADTVTCVALGTPVHHGPVSAGRQAVHRLGALRGILRGRCPHGGRCRRLRLRTQARQRRQLWPQAGRRVVEWIDRRTHEGC